MLPSPGDRFEARYDIIERLGERDFATYRARDVDAERDVVVKLLLRRAAADDASTAFYDRARALAALRDPHTARVIGCGTSAAGALFLVREHVPGRELGTLIAEAAPFDVSIVVRIVEQALASLRDAHARGITHGNLAPSNLIVYPLDNDPCRVKLTDFRIGHGVDVDPRDDVHSLGLIAFEMLTGEAPPGGDAPLVLRAPTVPAPVTAVVQQMIAHDPLDRPLAADALRAMMEARGVKRPPAPTAPPAAAAPPPPPPPPAEPTTTDRPVALLIVAFVLGVAAVYVALADAPSSTPEATEPPMDFSADAE